MKPDAPWLPFYGSTPSTLVYPERTMFGLLRDTAERYPRLPAYEFMGKRTSYAAFLNRIEKTAAAWRALGVQKGDRVTICLPNVPQGIDCFYALNRIGAVPNMVHPLSAVEEIVFYLNASHSKAVITLDRFYDKVAAAVAKAATPCPIVVAGIAEELPFLKKQLFPLTKAGKIAGKTQADGGVPWRTFLAAGEGVSLPPDDGRADDCAAILYSGGTTGVNKGIMLSNRNFNALGLQTLAASGYADIAGDSMLSVMPLFHGFGLGVGIHTALIGGACCILVPHFNVKTYAALLKSRKPNFIPGVPTLFAALVRAKELEHADLSFLKGVFSGGDSLSPELKKRVDAFLAAHHSPVPIREGYGTTECVTASCLTPIAHAKEGSIGIPFADTFYQIVAVGTDNSVPYGQEGEICLCGPSVMLGYMDQPEETALVLHRHVDGNLWLHTGDLGMMDEDGFVYFRQRIKRMIITSGYNVYPSQLEAVLDAHPGVAASCVIGVPDAMRVQRVRAYVVPAAPTDDPAALKAELLEYCRTHIAKYALPREILFRSELPKTLVGKIAYRQLEEEAKAEQTK